MKAGFLVIAVASSLVALYSSKHSVSNESSAALPNDDLISASTSGNKLRDSSAMSSMEAALRKPVENKPPTRPPPKLVPIPESEKRKINKPCSTETAKKVYGDAYDLWMAMLRHDYDTYIRPDFGCEPLVINIGLVIISFRGVSEVTMDYSVELYIREWWTDERLVFNVSQFGRTYLNINGEALNRIWKPDTNIMNAIFSRDPRTNSLSHGHLLRVTDDGTVYQVRRLYPFDEQTCKFQVTSFGYDTRDIIYRWSSYRGKSRPVELNENEQQMPDFYIKYSKTKVLNLTYPTGNFSIAEFCFVLRRNAGYCIVQLIFPASVVVAASWISLWLEDDTQFSDLISVILSILFLSYSYNNVMPKVSYVKAMDIYLGACLSFIFVSLCKLAIVKYGRKREKAQRNMSVVHSFHSLHDLQPAIIAVPEEFPETTLEDATTTNGGAEMNGMEQESVRAEPKRSLQHRQSHAVIGWKKRFGKPQLNLEPVLQKYKVLERPKQLVMHSPLWKAIKTFHVGSQLILPLAFLGFCVFFFLIYPATVHTEGC